MAEAAAVIGLVASIASLVDLGVRISARLHEFRDEASEVPESFRSLQKRLPLLNSTLTLIKQQVDTGSLSEEASGAIRSLICSTSAQLKIVETCLSSITPSSGASRVCRAVQALRSLTKDGDVRAAVKRIHRDIDLLVLHQTTQHVDAGNRILGALARLQLGQAQNSSLSNHQGHAFGDVVPDDTAGVQPGAACRVKGCSEIDEPRRFGLCLNSAPSIEQSSFVGRIEELKRIENLLLPGEPAGEQRRLILGGLGGIGKTQLAIAYARQHHASYTSVLWLNATSKLTLVASFRTIAETLLTAASTRKLDDEKALRIVFRWLSDARNARWLLIYDNYDNPDHFAIADYMPNTCNGTIIITTRLPDLIGGQRMSKIRVSTIKNVDESVQILQNRSQRDNVQQDPQARRLAERLAGLPLALATAGAYLRKTTLTLSEYLEAYEQRFVVDPRRALKLEEYAHRTLHTTWDLTYSRIEHDDPLAAKVLKLLAYFDNQEIWFELLNAGLDNLSPCWIQEVIRERIDFENIMGTLVEYCLVEPHPMTRSYSMRNCVHDWSLACLNRIHSEEMFWYAVRCVTGCIDEEHHDWEALGKLRYARLTRHALRFTIGQFHWLTDANVISVDHLTQFALIADVLSQHTQYSTAEQLYQRVIAEEEKVLGPHHTSTLTTINNLGLLHYTRCKFDKAERMYQQALAGFNDTLGPRHISTLMTINNLGLLHRAQGKLDNAEQEYQQALFGREQELGLEHVSTLDTVNNIGNLYADQGRLDEAERMYQRALIGRQQALGTDSTSTLMTVNNLGLLYATQGKVDHAERMYLRALAGYKITLPPDHTSILVTVNNLGLLYADQGRLEEAEQMFQQALAGKEKVLGPDHTSTLTTINNLGNLYVELGMFDDAERMYQRTLMGREQALGPNHTSTLDSKHCLANLCCRRDELGRAEIIYEQLLVEYENAVGDNHPSTMLLVTNFGVMYERQGRVEMAKRMYQRALLGYQKCLGLEHPETRNVTVRFTKLCHQQDQTEDTHTANGCNSAE